MAEREIKAITWNVFHGRDWPPEPALQVAKGRLSGEPIRGAAYVQVNRDLLAAFSAVLSAADWEVCMLQECPPRFAAPLRTTCEAAGFRVFTSRYWLLPLTQAIAHRRPDLLGASEGGCNLTLIRPGAGAPISTRRHTLCTGLPERRAMSLVALDSGLCVANLHASQEPERAAAELIDAAVVATEFARGRPLLFGGDTNVRPAQNPVFDRLAGEFGLAAPTAPKAIDHLLVTNGLEVTEKPAPWEPQARDVRDPDTGLAIRLSDHAPVQARLRF